MGWTSTGDPYANVGDSALSFDSKEAAVAFAERHGWDYTVWSPLSEIVLDEVPEFKFCTYVRPFIQG